MPAMYVYGMYRHVHSSCHVCLQNLESHVKQLECFAEIYHHRLDAHYHGNEIYVSVYITVKLGVAGASLSELHTDHMYGNLSVSVVRPFGPR